MSPAGQAPVAWNERISNLDTVRGIAVLGMAHGHVPDQAAAAPMTTDRV